jgi:hypothetical protein
LHSDKIGFSFHEIGVKRHGTTADGRWLFMLKTPQREYGGSIIESLDPKSGFVL